MNDQPFAKVERYLATACEAIKKKDLIDFVENVSKADACAENNQTYMAKVMLVRSKGLYKFNQYRKALTSIAETLKYDISNEEIFTLSGYRAIILGHLGEYQNAKDTLIPLIENRPTDANCVDVFITLSWISLLTYRGYKKEADLEEAKKYLDAAKTYFTHTPNRLKWKIYNNYSVYYFYQGNYEEAIHMLEEALLCCEEKDYPWVYTNMADIYLKFEGIDVAGKIKECTEKAEIIAHQYNNNYLIGRAFYLQALSELKEDMLFRCLDTLYVAFEHFKKAEAYPFAFDCLIKMNEIISDYKLDQLKSLKDSLNKEFKDTMHYNVL